ncbi:hypothetical protein RN001_005445 [Aquatica leii]|uniref:NADPH:adrenodoxin oxidoreductase, mitochondrial n=1 Tax=Aquatica leii TaxID=1421715 RepID=A0AAN7PJV8_9COLE|nr:hypothetical protein RN001_005445 [Aquatica leii]
MRTLCSNAFKRFYSTQLIKKKVCIVGAGPAGFYAAQHLVKCLRSVEVDIYERLPVPFGLVRFGVAPDHPEVKNVINTFSKTAENPNVRFVGNVNLGTDVSLKQLREAYDCVLLTYGAEQNKRLNIPGEDLVNVIPARRIVGWYNGIIEDSNLKIDLSGPTVAIFGQGNVAIDVARILLTPIDLLKDTDITQHALEALSQSKVKEVHLIGRRGPLQAAFTIKELREMLRLPNCNTLWCRDDFNGLSDVISSLARPRKRITELMLKSLNENSISDRKCFKPIFFKSPLELSGTNHVKKVLLGVNELYGDDILNGSARLTNVKEYLSCELAITSIGYKAIQADPDIPFDDDTGRVINEKGKIDNGLYTTGWLATGPTGVILTTMNNAFTTADLICHNLQQESQKKGFNLIREYLQKQNVQSVTWDGWKKIDNYEQEQGRRLGKPREKLLSIKKMLEIAS